MQSGFIGGFPIPITVQLKCIIYRILVIVNRISISKIDYRSPVQAPKSIILTAPRITGNSFRVCGCIIIFLACSCIIGCYSYSRGYFNEGLLVKTEKTEWSMPSEIEPRVVKHVLRHWDSDRKLTRLEEQRTAVAIIQGLAKNGYAKLFLYAFWIEVYVHRDNPDRLVSKKLMPDEKKSEEFELNLIEYR